MRYLVVASLLASFLVGLVGLAWVVFLHGPAEDIPLFMTALGAPAGYQILMAKGPTALAAAEEMIHATDR